MVMLLFIIIDDVDSCCKYDDVNSSSVKLLSKEWIIPIMNFDNSYDESGIIAYISMFCQMQWH